MNSIYKVIWSKAKNCYVVASEIAKSHTKSASGQSVRRSALSSLLALSLLCGGLGVAEASVHVNENTGGAYEVLTKQEVTDELNKKVSREVADLKYAKASDVTTNAHNISTLDGKVTAHETAINELKTADTALDQKIEAEKLERSASDQALDQKIEAEKLKRSESDQALNASIKANKTAIGELKAKDTELEGKINTLDASGVKYDTAVKDKITLAGAGGTTITNLKDAALNDSSTEAVTGKQLNQTNERTAGIEYDKARDETTIGGQVTVNSIGDVTARGKLTAKGGVNAGNSDIITTGEVNAGSLNVENASHLKGDVTMDNNLTVKGDTTLKGTKVDGKLAVTDDADLKNTKVDGTLITTGKATFQEAVEMDKGLTVTNGDTKLKATTVDGKLTAGEADLKDTKVDGKLGVTGETTLEGALTAKGEATFEKNVTVEKDLTVNGKLNVGEIYLENNKLDAATGEKHDSATAITADGISNLAKVTEHGNTTESQFTHNKKGTINYAKVKNSTGDWKGSTSKVTADGVSNEMTDSDGNTHTYSQTATESKEQLVNGDKSNFEKKTAEGNTISIKDKDAAGNPKSLTNKQTVDGEKTSVTNNESSSTINQGADQIRHNVTSADGKKSSIEVKADGITNTSKDGTITNDAKDIVNNATGNMTNTVGADLTTTVGGDELHEVTGNKTENVTGMVKENYSNGQETNVTGNQDIHVTGKQTNEIGGDQENTIGGDQTTTVKGNVNEVYEKNLTTTVGGNELHEVTGTKTENVTGKVIENYGNGQETNVTGDQYIHVTGKQTNKIDGDQENIIGGNQTTIVTGDISNKAENITNEANTKLTDKVGDNTRVLDSEGITDTVPGAGGKGSTFKQRIDAIMGNVKTDACESEVTQKGDEITSVVGKGEATISRVTQKKGSIEAVVTDGTSFNHSRDIANASAKTLTGYGKMNQLLDDLNSSTKTITDGTHKTSKVQTALDITNTAADGTITNDAKNIVNNASGDMTNTVGGKLTTTVTGATEENYNGGLTTNVTGEENHTVTGKQNNKVTGKQTNTVEGGQENIISGGQTNTITGGQINNITGDQTTTITGNKTETVTENVTEDYKKNLTTTVGGNEIHEVKGTKTETVEGKVIENFKGGQETNVTGNQDIHVTGKQTNKIDGDQVNTIGGDQTTNVTGDISNTAENITNAAKTSLTDKVGTNTRVTTSRSITDTVGRANRMIEDGKITDNAGDFTVTTDKENGTTFTNAGSTASSFTTVDGTNTGSAQGWTNIKGNEISTGKVEANYVKMDYADVMHDLGVHGSATVDNDLTVKGITTTKTLKVTENATVGGTLDVTKKATFHDDVDITKNLSVGGNATIAGDVTARSYKVDGKTYIDANGINANDQKITNVADGSISEGSKDAVNGGQLYGVKRDLEHQVDKVGANAAAMANLRPMEFDPSSKWNIAAAIGNYGSETAAAIGAFYRPNDNVMVNLSTAFGTGENMVGGGVSVRLGKGGNKLSRAETNALKAQVADLTARMDALLSVLNPNMSKDFPDVPENHWAYEAVSRLAGNDIVQGYPDGEFHGERTMTRYEMAEIIYNALSRGAEAERKLVEEFKPELQAMAASEKATGEKAEG